MKLAALLLILLTTGPLMAQDRFESLEKVLSERVHHFNIELNATTVLCSQAGYSASFLKILIPQLADVTFLDHRNFGAEAPCVAAGECAPIGDRTPGEIIDLLKPTETVEVKVVATRVLTKDNQEKKCNVTLKEEIFTNVRGAPFYHIKSASLNQRNFEDCR